MFSFIFGASTEGRSPPTIQEGHKAVEVVIDGERLKVDVDVLAEVSGLFLQVQSTDQKECPLLDFPGGLERFRDIVGFLVDHEPLAVTEETVLDLMEATWLLECPRLLEDVMESAYAKSLSSRRRAEILEHILPYTAASSPADSEHAAELLASMPNETDVLGNWTEHGMVSSMSPSVTPALACGQFLRLFHFETLMWQTTERAAIRLASELDSGDFILGPRLATGSLRVCAELLRLQRLREEESGFVTTAMQPVSALWKNLMDKPLRAKVSWDSHLFALRCMRRRLAAAAPPSMAARTSAEMAGELKEDEQAHTDLPTELCEAAQDSTLICFVELVAFVDVERLYPNWSALLIRTLLLLEGPESGLARKVFKATFAQSLLVQRLAWCPAGAPAVPAAWLADVVAHPDSSKALLRVLAGYRSMEAEEFCDLVEHVLLAQFLSWDHCNHMILQSELVNELVGACLDAGRKAAALPGHAIPSLGERRCPAHWAGQHVLWRLEHLGRRLFDVSFVFQEGFLPHSWPDCLEGDGRAMPGPLLRVMAAEDDVCCPQPQVVEVQGTCLWDEGLLTIPLLRPTMMEGRSVTEKPILHYGRQVIMRHLWYKHSGTYCDVPKLKSLWDLACWSLCEDAGLIRQALEYLKGTYRELCRPQGSWTADSEEAIFQMFLAIDLSVLPMQALQSPWVPVQVQTVRLFVQQKPADQFHEELQQEFGRATEHLKSIDLQCAKLSEKLNVVEQRTVMNKSQISESSIALEEHQRRKREASK
ncbi:hypothetical protein AK812_SmicGene39243 [Symbiodinium microadriaticum]|uniref:Uncharacterized protein n=1 Tax=Symbiodinium microadriaticum TaxID=2951 RepID=A0A1Q9CBP7_SYMMI|nr:hypothetical protein AK812_SmicGene39243 [Symbiodinium microadriaticum]CAE7367699.1 unnamed protein product [Symbiodinium sp. KB8]CAE7545924.1 unnamed protein product [Symbiodinium microadriaticum]